MFKRNHQKVILVDDNVFIGSSNIGEDYGGPKYGNDSFLDLNIRMKGYVTEKLYETIDNVILKNKPKRLKLSKNKRKKQKMFESFKDSPRFKDSDYVDKDKYNILISNYSERKEIQNSLYRNMLAAKKKIVILAPYYYDSILKYFPLKEIAQSGVEVEILTSQKRDISCYKDLLNNLLFKELIDSGVKVYEYPDKFLHGKAFLFDDQVLQIGSFNLDGWSFQNNTGTFSSNLISRN
jgi:cardiolipin synthase